MDDYKPAALVAAVAIVAGLTPSLAGSTVSARVDATSELLVRVTNVRNARGEVRVEVCPQATFLREDCKTQVSAPAKTGLTLVTVRGLPAGRYAVQSYHDENGNRRIDRALFGIPREGVAFSNDAPIRFGPPKWADAVFTFSGGEQTIQVRTRYLMTAPGLAQH